MKTKRNFHQLCLLAALLLAGTACAQSISPLYSFTNGPASPGAGLTLGPDGNFYGTTTKGGNGGGSSGYGTVFEVTTNGVLTTLANFNSVNGATPEAALTLGPDGNFYGTTSAGGSSNLGTVFQVTTNGVLTTLVNFNSTNGATPKAALTLGPDGNFYGTTYSGGAYYGGGTVFQVTTNGMLTTLYSFGGGEYGGYPQAALTLGPDGNFYGTTAGLDSVPGTIFQISTNGVLTTLVTLGGTNGWSPSAALVLGPDGKFYGTTDGGGGGRDGTVFQVTTNGLLNTLVTFSGEGPGVKPLILGPDGNFYGTSSSGGYYGYGTFFKISTNGVWTELLEFVDNGFDGGSPNALTLGPDGSFYGTTEVGTANGSGTVFRLTADGTLTTLKYFIPDNGESPMAALTLGPDGNFYGTTRDGGSDPSDSGTVFRVAPNGTLATLVNFNVTNGASPYGHLTLGPDGNFYGTTASGGDNHSGTIYRMTTNGALTTLVSFSGDGLNPEAALTLGSDGNFYGTTTGGGSSAVGSNWGYGTIFQVTTDGLLNTLVNFNSANGAHPFAALTLGPDGNFYGSTGYGGNTNLNNSSGYGTVFQVTTNGTLTTLYSFIGGSDGGLPESALTLGRDGNFYGTTYSGGSSNLGTVFQMTTNGVLTTLVNFNSTNGANPLGDLTLGPDGNFYGTTYSGGSSNLGTVFQMTPNGVLTTLANFNWADGAYPFAALTLGPDWNFYGTTAVGGSGVDGEIYRLNLPAFQFLQPVARFTGAPTNGYTPLRVVFTDASSGPFTNELWNFGDGHFITNSTGTSANVANTYSVAGNYTVTLTVSGPGGVSTDTQSNYVAVFARPSAPVAGFAGSPTNGYAPLSVVFADTSSGTITNWVWNFGNGRTVTNTSSGNMTNVYATLGKYTVSLKVTGPGGANTNTQNSYVVVSNPPPPTAGFTGTPTNGYAPLPVIFTDTSSGSITNWVWNFGNGYSLTNSTGGTVTNTYTAAGKYPVSLKVTGLGGANTNTKSSYVNVSNAPPPTAVFTGAPTNGYAPLQVVFQDASTGEITNRVWNFGNGHSLTNTIGGNATNIYTAVGKYTVSLKVAGPGGANTNPKTSYITVTGPVAGFTGTPTNGYAPLQVVFSDTSGGAITNWVWDFGNGHSITNTASGSVTNSYATAGKYTVSLKVAGAAGTNTLTKTNYVGVSVPPAPVAGFSATPTNGYAPLPVIFNDTSSGNITNWVWNFGNGHFFTNTIGGNVTNLYIAATNYTVTLKVAGMGGTNQVTKTNYIVVWRVVRLGQLALSGGKLMFSGTNGTAGQQYRILESSNLVDWYPVLTNTFLADGSYSCTNLMATNHLGYFRLIAP